MTREEAATIAQRNANIRGIRHFVHSYTMRLTGKPSYYISTQFDRYAPSTMIFNPSDEPTPNKQQGGSWPKKGSSK